MGALQGCPDFMGGCSRRWGSIGRSLEVKDVLREQKEIWCGWNVWVVKDHIIAAVYPRSEESHSKVLRREE